MKKNLKIICLLFLMLITMVPHVEAKNINYINENGIEMNEAIYKLLLERTNSEADVKYMDQENYDFYTAADWRIMDKKEKFVRVNTVYEDGQFVNKSEEISKMEYDLAANNNLIQPRGLCPGYISACWETSYKRVLLTISANGSNWKIKTTNTWLKIPYIKSFDVIATMWLNANNTFKYTSYSGTQDYKINGVAGRVSYPQGVANAKTAAVPNVDGYGIGISMNIVDAVTSDLVNTLEINGYTEKSNQGSIMVYSTYQHAQSSLTLDSSKGYTFGGTIGGVLNFSNSTIRDTYDKMTGVEATLYP